jgi:microcephalin
MVFLFSIRETVLAVVNQLGEYEIQKEVDHNTTHVVSTGKRRTVNVLKAILSGCWLLSVEWVLKSLEKGFWIKEEPFELVEDFPAAKVSMH